MILTQENNKIFLSNTGVEMLKKLPVGNYLLVNDSIRGLALVPKPSFKHTSYILGDFEEVATRYIKTFSSSEKGIGILLTGLKGGGKSLLARLTATKSNLPCIIINEYFEANTLLNFLTEIKQEVIVLIDEFEKIYNSEEKQNDMLGILDGVLSHKKMFILTSNTAEINPYLINRPGRIRYHKIFEGVSQEVVEQLVEDKLVNKEHSEDLIEITKALGNISFDSLVTIVEEMNLYAENAREVIKHLNVNIEMDNYEVVLLIKGQRFSTTFFGHPLYRGDYSLTYRGSADNYGWTPREEYKVNLNYFDIEYEPNGKIRLRHKTNSDSLIFVRLHQAKFEI